MENQMSMPAAAHGTARRKRAAFRAGFGFVLLLWLGALAAPVLADQGQTLLWRIEAEGLAPSYLLGTMHHDDPRVATLPPPVAKVLADSRVLYLEIDFASPEIALAPLAQVLPPGQSLDQLLDAELYRRVVEVMSERGYAEQTVRRLRPWAVFLELAMPPMETGRVLDVVLYEYALERGIPARGLETIGEQLGIFDNMSLDDQRALLVLTLDEYAEAPAVFEEMIVLYQARDLAALKRFSDEAMDGLPADVRTRFDTVFLVERNQRMATRALPALERGGAFIAVGALHLPGEDGLIRLLEARGFRLVPVY